MAGIMQLAFGYTGTPSSPGGGTAPPGATPGTPTDPNAPRFGVGGLGGAGNPGGAGPSGTPINLGSQLQAPLSSDLRTRAGKIKASLAPPALDAGNGLTELAAGGGGIGLTT